jgi:hypothetical protein
VSTFGAVLDMVTDRYFVSFLKENMNKAVELYFKQQYGTVDCDLLFKPTVSIPSFLFFKFNCTKIKRLKIYKNE